MPEVALPQGQAWPREPSRSREGRPPGGCFPGGRCVAWSRERSSSREGCLPGGFLPRGSTRRSASSGMAWLVSGPQAPGSLGPGGLGARPRPVPGRVPPLRPSRPRGGGFPGDGVQGRLVPGNPLVPRKVSSREGSPRESILAFWSSAPPSVLLTLVACVRHAPDTLPKARRRGVAKRRCSAAGVGATRASRSGDGRGHPPALTKGGGDGRGQSPALSSARRQCRRVAPQVARVVAPSSIKGGPGLLVEEGEIGPDRIG